MTKNRMNCGWYISWRFRKCHQFHQFQSFRRNHHFVMGLKSQKLSPVIIRLNLPRVQNDATNDGFSYFVWFRSGSGFWKKKWKILDKNFRLFCDDMIISKLQNSSSKAASSTFFLNHKLIVLRSFIFDCLAKLRKHQWFFSYRGQNLYQWLFSVSGFSVELQKK